MAGKPASSDAFSNVIKAIQQSWLAVVILLLGLTGFFYKPFGILLYKVVLYGFFPLFGTGVLGWIAWKVWVHYIQQDFISGIEFVMLEVIPPRDVDRSPMAMELFITNALYHFSYKGGKEEFWQGAVWFWFSLELVSIDGQVHFYIRTPSRIRGLIETQMYAQYPQSQIKEVEDYTLAVDEITPKSEWNAWACEWGLLRHEAYPIKTYVDYTLNEDPKEEYKIDPISPVIEFFGSLHKGEQAWLQIVITPSKKRYHTKGTWFEYHDWVREARFQLIKLLHPYTYTPDSDVSADGVVIGTRTPKFLDPTIERIGNKTTKLGFDTGIRLMYVAKKDIYPPGTRTNHSRDIRLIFRQYTNPDANGFNRINPSQGDRYSGIFTASKETVMMLANRMLKEYRERSFHHEPLRQKIFSQGIWEFPWPGVFTLSGIIKAYVHTEIYVLNTEELATIWHFPGQILKVPTLERIESKEASPPTNLPT